MKSRTKTNCRRTPQEVQALLGLYHKSGMSVASFCKQERVATSVLYRWLRREGEKKPAVKFVEVKTERTVVPGSFVVKTPRGYEIEVPVGFDEDSFKRLVGVLLK